MWIRSLLGLFLVWILSFRLVLSQPSQISVDLEAKWTEPPFALEILQALSSSGNPYNAKDNTLSQDTFTSDSDVAFFNLWSELVHLLHSGEVSIESAKDVYSSVKENFEPEWNDLVDFDLRLHSSAPLIEAHFEHYQAGYSSLYKNNQNCASWVLVDGKQICDAKDLFWLQFNPKSSLSEQSNLLAFDKFLAVNNDVPPAILYADIADPNVVQFTEILEGFANEGKLRFILRFKPSTGQSPTAQQPLHLAGYGVGLRLKRTDYIVIDDRARDVKETVSSFRDPTGEESSNVFDAGVDAITAVDKDDLFNLGTKAAFIVKQSKDPLNALEKLNQDFPKYASKLADIQLDSDFDALEDTTKFGIPPASSEIFLNGALVDPALSDDVYGIFDALKREIKFVRQLEKVGLTKEQARNLIIDASEVKTQGLKSLRFEYLDDRESNKAIVWLNDLEKDAQYKSWPNDISDILNGGHGQLVQLRKKITQIVFPLNLASISEAHFLLSQLQASVNEKIPIEIGVVPIIGNEDSESYKIAHAFYDLYDRGGVRSALRYLQVSIRNQMMTRSQVPRIQYDPQVYDEVLKEAIKQRNVSPELALQHVKAAKAWSKRLGVLSDDTIFFVNGRIADKSSGWIMSAAKLFFEDVDYLRSLLETGEVSQDTNIPRLWSKIAFSERNELLLPPSDDQYQFIDLIELSEKFPWLTNAPRVSNSKSSQIKISTILLADFDSQKGIDLFRNVLAALSKYRDSAEVIFIHKPRSGTYSERPNLSLAIYQLHKEGLLENLSIESLSSLLGSINHETAVQDWFHVEGLENAGIGGAALEKGIMLADYTIAAKFWNNATELVNSISAGLPENIIITNGRVVHVPVDADIADSDFVLSFIELEADMRTNPFYAIFESQKDLDSIIKKDPRSIPKISSLLSYSQFLTDAESSFLSRAQMRSAAVYNLTTSKLSFSVNEEPLDAEVHVLAIINPVSENAQKYIPILKALSEISNVYITVYLNPPTELSEMPITRFYRSTFPSKIIFNDDGSLESPEVNFAGIPEDTLFSLEMDVPRAWVVFPFKSNYDLDNILLEPGQGGIDATYRLEGILIEGHATEKVKGSLLAPRGLELQLVSEGQAISDTVVMANLGYFQFISSPGVWKLDLKPGALNDNYDLTTAGIFGLDNPVDTNTTSVVLSSFRGSTIFPRVIDKSRAKNSLFSHLTETIKYTSDNFKRKIPWISSLTEKSGKKQADINIFSVASGHLYERFLGIMTESVMKHTNHTVKFWFIENFLSPSFKEFLPTLAENLGFDYELVTYHWPWWLRGQKEKQREIWGYKILFLDVLFPLDLKKVIFVDADQIVRTDMKELVELDLHGAPYGFTPMCDSREEMEGFRFWKQGYWKNYLKGKPYHISALYVVDLIKFRQLAAGDRLREQYQQLSRDPNSLSNLDQDLPNNMQFQIPIYSLPQEWLWCETWCSDESLKTAKTIDLCNNPLTKEPKLDRARRQVPEWTSYDDDVSEIFRRSKHDSSQKEEDKATIEVGNGDSKGPKGKEDSTTPDRDEL